jgi:hypothetical protein
MVVEQGPGVAVGFGLLQEEAEAGKEIEAILIVKEDGSLLDSSDDNVLKQTGDIYAGVSGHEDNISLETENIKNVPLGSLKLKISRTSPLGSLWVPKNAYLIGGEEYMLYVNC